jgi:hypothetical protein
MTGMGLFLFGDVVVTVPLLVGLTMSLVGAVTYSISKLPASTQTKTK